MPNLVAAGAHVQATGAFRRFSTGAKLAAVLKLWFQQILQPGGMAIQGDDSTLHFQATCNFLC